MQLQRITFDLDLAKFRDEELVVLARECGYQPAIFMAEKVLNEPPSAQGTRISMTSTPEPGPTSPGHPRAIPIASSRLSAETTM